MKRKKMKNRYRRFSFITDIGGMKSAFGELRGRGHPEQPRLNKDHVHADNEPVLDERWFIDTINDKISNHPDNIMEYPFYGERIFDKPLVGFVRGDDPILLEYKNENIIGPHYFTPYEIMAWQAKKNGVVPPPAEDISVVSIVMPLTKNTKGENASKNEWPSERWAQTRMHGEFFSQIYIREIVTYLMARGVLTVSPDVTPVFNKKRYPGIGWASPWSHRHMAYAAGLGTFGMHDFLITEKGCAHRCASFAVNLKLTPNRKRPDDIHAYCSQYQGRECLKCMKRCPVDAISRDNAHDKERCYKRVAHSTKYCNSNYHIFIYGCGLCATGVPCESKIPAGLGNK